MVVSRESAFGCWYIKIDQPVVLAGAKLPESPHVYKKDGWYYLLIAEGGEHHQLDCQACRDNLLTYLLPSQRYRAGSS